MSLPMDEPKQPEQPEFHYSIDITPNTTLPQWHTTGIPDPHAETQRQLQQLIGLSTEMLKVGREQLDLMRRAEERYLRQQQVQRDDFDRWLNEHEDLPQDAKLAEEVVRKILGQSLANLANYVAEHNEEMLELDYLKSELCDRFGASLGHLSLIYGLLRRVVATQQHKLTNAKRTERAERANNTESNPPPEPPKN